MARRQPRHGGAGLRGGTGRPGIDDATGDRWCERARDWNVSRRRRETLAMAEAAVKRAPGRGRFISFEGGEGSGKSTQIKTLAERLDAAKLRAIVTREPGGSPGAEIIRHLVLSGMGKLLGPDAETLLFAAARHDRGSQARPDHHPRRAGRGWVATRRRAPWQRCGRSLRGRGRPVPS